MNKHFATLVDLMDRDFVTPAAHDRIIRLAKIIARETGRTVADVLEAAR